MNFFKKCNLCAIRLSLLSKSKTGIKFMKTKTTTLLLILLLTSFMFTGCYGPMHRVEGNYDVQTETREVASFNRVINEGDFEVYIIQDSLDKVVIEAESNLIPLIRTRIDGSALVIDTKDNLQNNYPMKVYVHATELNEVKLSGSGLMQANDIVTGDLDISISGSGDIFFSGTAQNVNSSISGSGKMDLGLVCNELDADISGSGDIEIVGTANNGIFHISGSGSIHAYDFTLKECHATISGSGSMFVTVTDYLNVNISGSGDVYYMGAPVIDSKITGSGSVIHP
jgi:hypothetical protein